MANRFHTIAKTSSTARGYGHKHRLERQRRVAVHTPDSPCSRCGRRLGSNKTLWHLPHNATRTGYMDGLWCADCNRRDGARRGGQRSRKASQGRASTLTW